METMQTVTTLITTVGFPITCCIAMGWYVKNQMENYRADIQALNSRHADEVKQLTETINNNTLALQHLCDKLGVN